MATPPYTELNIIRAMIDYLSPEAGTWHVNRVQSELSERIKAAPRSELILKALLGKPAHIPLSDLQAYLAEVGEDLMGQLLDFDQDPASPFSYVSFDQAPVHEQVPLFDLCAKWHPEDQKIPQINALIKIAVLSGNAVLLERIQTEAKLSDSDLILRIEQSAGLEEAGTDAAEFIENLLRSADFTNDAWSGAIHEIIRKKRSRSFALLLANGWSPFPALTDQTAPRKDGSWIERFAYRLSVSRHAALKILKELPNTAQILNMSPAEINSMLGGPDSKMQKRQTKFAKMEESVRHFTDKGIPVPEGLARGYVELKASLKREK